MTDRTWWRLGVMVPCLLLGLDGCSSTDPSPVPSTISAATATGLTAAVGSQVGPLPAVKVISDKGAPMGGVDVIFTLTGGGSIAGDSTKTDSQGIATLGGWTLGTRPGNYSVAARVGSLAPVTFTATATPGAPGSIAMVAGGGQSAGVGQPLGTQVIIEVKDQYGNLVPAIAVALSVTGGGGTLPGASVATGSDGRATLPVWTMGTSAGTQELRLTAGSASLTLTATATPGAPSSLAVVSGDGQTGDLGVALAAPLGVKVADQYGNGVPGVTVSFAVSTGNVTLSPNSAVTGSSGTAQVQATLQAVGGSNVTATASALAPASFSFSTGPTIIGTITDLSMSPVVGAVARAATMSGPRAVPTPQRRVINPAFEPSSKGRLLVTFNQARLSLPAAAASFRSSRELNQIAAASYEKVINEHLPSTHRKGEMRSLPAIATTLVVLADPTEQAQVIAQLKRDPRVLAVEEDHLVHADVIEEDIPGREEADRKSGALPSIWPGLSLTPPLQQSTATERYSADPFLVQQLWHYRMVDFPRVWSSNTGAPSVRVGVLDTGVRPDHPQLAGLISTTEGFDFVDGVNDAWSAAQPLCEGGTMITLRGPASVAGLPRNGTDPMQYRVNQAGTCWEPNPNGSHGTHVTGTIASRGTDGVMGVGGNWETTIVPIRVLGVQGSGWEFDVAQGMLYAGGFPVSYTGAPAGFQVQIPPVPIINMSLGGTSPSTVKANASAAIQATTLVIASRGNDNFTTPSYPASYPGVVAVSALDPEYRKASYSNYGSDVSLSAPGGDSRIGGSSWGVFSALWDFQTMTPTFSYLNGTSMATPHVTAVAALTLAANPGLTPEQLRQRLINGAVDLGPAGRDNIFGYGLVNAYNSVTGTSGPPVSTRVRVLDAATGAVVRSIKPGPDGKYFFTRLPVGEYRIVSSQDESGDGLFGKPGRRFALSGNISVGPAEVKTLNLGQGYSDEVEPNNTVATAQELVIDSWVTGSLWNTIDQDFFSFQVPSSGTYTFETSGILAACGTATAAATELQLLDKDGNLVTSNTSTSYPRATYPGGACSLISSTLTPGKYYLGVKALVTGKYRLHLRSGE